MDPRLLPIILRSPLSRDPLWAKARMVPSLDLRMEDALLRDAVSGQRLVTFTRATTGTYVGSDGLIKTAAIDEPRITHDPQTGRRLGLLVEEARANLLTYSEEFSNASWTTSTLFAAVTANAGTAPNGDTSADLIAGATTAADQIYQTVTVANATAYTLSYFIKSVDTTSTRIGIFSPPSTWLAYVDIAWTAGVPSTGSTSGSPANITYTNYGNGWYRCSFTATTATTSYQIHFHPDRTNNQKSAYLWGAQLEAGSFPTSYIPTTSSTVTRAADIASITGSNFSSWYRQDEGSLFIEAGPYPGVTGINYAIVSANAGSYNDGVHIFAGSGPSAVFAVREAGVDQCYISAGLFLDPARASKISAAYALNNFARSLYGNPAATDNSGTVPTFLNQFRIGSIPSISAISAINGPISRLTYWPSRLPDSTLQELTR